jgi:hypothetical protein
MTDLTKSLPQLIIGTALLAVAVVLGWTGHLNATDTFTVVNSLSLALGVSGGIVLGNATVPNSNLAPHLAFTVLLLAAVTALTLHNVFTSTQILPIVGAFLVGGGLAAGSASGTPVTGPLPLPPPLPRSASATTATQSPPADPATTASAA